MYNVFWQNTNHILLWKKIYRKIKSNIEYLYSIRKYMRNNYCEYFACNCWNRSYFRAIKD